MLKKPRECLSQISEDEMIFFDGFIKKQDGVIYLDLSLATKEQQEPA